MDQEKWLSLKTVDKEVARKRARERYQVIERADAGVGIPPALVEASQKPLDVHLKDYAANLVARNRAGRRNKGAKQLSARVRVLIKECKWYFAGDVKPQDFEKWRASTKISPTTRNHYLGDMNAFLNWMLRQGLVLSNPLACVEKVDTRGKLTRVRRSLSPEELAKLLAASEKRAIVYLTAARTGFRREELVGLKVGDVHLDGSNPYILIRASTTKNRKAAKIPLTEELANALRIYLDIGAPVDRYLFPRLVPKCATLQKDLKAAGIPYKDARGRYADFHSLRMTWNVFLQTNGVSPAVARALMRHSDFRLTMDTYLDQEALPIEKSIKNLPTLKSKSSDSECAPNSAHKIDVNCHSLSLPVDDLDYNDSFEPVVNWVVSRLLTWMRNGGGGGN